jgi:polyhydroxyalkanoate synthase
LTSATSRSRKRRSPADPKASTATTASTAGAGASAAVRAAAKAASASTARASTARKPKQASPAGKAVGSRAAKAAKNRSADSGRKARSAARRKDGSAAAKPVSPASPARTESAVVGTTATGTAAPVVDAHGSAIPAWKLDQEALVKLQNEYVTRATELLGQFAAGKPPVLQDRRFSGKAWQEHPQYGWQAAWYLLNADFMQRTAELIEADRKTRDRIRYLTEQWVDACSPANFLASNPEAQAKLLETGGESLLAGVNNLLSDLGRGKISQTDLNAFEVGRNVGTTPGSVVYQNELVQLIQYEPTTTTVGKRPLLIVPPSINKYYILDLQPENSFIAHAVAEGNTVFVVSWRNVKEPQGHLTWDDYLQLGVVETLAVVRRITGSDTVNTLGFCVGGTLLCAALAALAARGERPAASLTLLTTLLDFADPGTLGIFVDEMHVALREQTIGRGGIMPGRELATTFSSLRPNDLVWNYVVSNYLKGESPPAFDLLYWNADSTNLPGPMFCWYLRHTYLQNELREPGKLICLGQPVDLRSIDVPTYVLCTTEDHIVPWRAGFASAQALAGRRRFVLGASGHIAGVINPPAKKKRSYRTGPDIDGLTPDQWLERSTEHPGSWWTDWYEWMAPHRGPEVRAPARPGAPGFPVIEPAPGSYVKEPSE